MKLTAEHVRAVAPENPDPEGTAQALTPAMRRFEIDQTPERVGMFLAQLAHESGLTPKAENLNYRAERLMEVWPARFPSLSAAQPYAHNPQKLANFVYGGRMGNRAGTDDGWNFRGRGYIQLTGRDNYARYGKLVGADLGSRPALLMDPGVSALVAAAFWAQHGCNDLADQGDMISITQRINGGQNGFADRLARYRRVIPLLRRDDLKELDPPVPEIPALPVKPAVVPTPAPTPVVVPVSPPERHRLMVGQKVGEKSAAFRDLAGHRFTITNASRVTVNDLSDGTTWIEWED